MIPRFAPANGHFTTQGGLTVDRSVRMLPDGPAALAELAHRLDETRGLLMVCDVTVAGRYRPRAVGFAAPPIAVTARGRHVTVEALNRRGQMLLPILATALELEQSSPTLASGTVADSGEPADELARTRRASAFTLVRRLRDLIAAEDDHFLGLYGVFGYDLGLQIDPIRQRLQRDPDQRDMVLYLPDQIVLADPEGGPAHMISYDFSLGLASTAGRRREAEPSPVQCGNGSGAADDHLPGAYAAVVRQALEHFRRGDLFEAVPSQTFARHCTQAPSAVFARLRQANPAPYGLLANLGEGEALVSASPEMFVRAEGGRSDGNRIETAPISGTVARGRDALADAEAILSLLGNAKEAAELTMCTDVDRNDKARVCAPGSVRILGRREIEVYSRLIHTVDHVEGTLRPGMDALDAFLSHAWAVTVTGAPKKWAMQFIEDHEASPRRWYGGAFGAVLADGGLDTGLTLRTIRLHDGIAEVRVGATLLMGSDPDAEDRECRLKASALLDALEDVPKGVSTAPPPAYAGRRVLVVDHEDSFVHTLADYFRQWGAETRVVRQPAARAALAEFTPDLMVLSPGPGRPQDFHLSDTLDAALDSGTAVFGICLGLQGIAEHFGGTLALGAPAHGKPAHIRVLGGRLFASLPAGFRAGRYHSLHADHATLPACLEVTAELEDGMVMALEHRTLPVAGVQFHPESLLSLGDGIGLALIGNVLERLRPVGGRAAA
ncbi:MAG: anthranilate synthase component I [Magnetospirillum sp.]|nr:anthranilate synthase component I [Magnetospirillum sp.]